MATLRIQINEPRPYFAELPYYLWGAVNYDSEGDCRKPTDRDWTTIELEHRDTRERVVVGKAGELWEIEADQRSAARLAMFLIERCGAGVDGEVTKHVGDWNHGNAFFRANRVAREFEEPSLKPFDSHLWWGSWKWIGGFASDLTFSGRMIMHSVVCRDPRGIPFCIGWLKSPPRFSEQITTLCYALERITGERARTPQEWVRWYDGGWISKGAKRRYPEPDMENWLNELKLEFDNVLSPD